jgi:uncharacterized protein
MSPTLTLDSPFQMLAVSAIRLYRRCISPYKGFRCAHHALHQQGSCSHYGLHVFREHPPRQAWRLLQGRFRECMLAHRTIRIQQGEPEREKSGGSGSGVWEACAGIGACLEIASCLSG